MTDIGRIPANSGLGKRLLDAMLIGFPDAVTSLWCLWVWIDPMALGSEAVKCVVLMMQMEFILLNATGLFTAIPFMFAFGRSVRNAMLFGLCGLYLALVGWFGMKLEVVWPFFAFGWLALAKLAWIVRNRRVCYSEQTWLKGTWAVSLVVYLGVVGISVTQSLPRLGIVPAIVPSLHLSGGSAWYDTPHEAVASAVFYFAAMAIFKWLYVAIRKSQPSRSQLENSSTGPTESLDPVG
jgi:hypothetical protein